MLGGLFLHAGAAAARKGRPQRSGPSFGLEAPRLCHGVCDDGAGAGVGTQGGLAAASVTPAHCPGAALAAGPSALACVWRFVFVQSAVSGQEKAAPARPPGALAPQGPVSVLRPPLGSKFTLAVPKRPSRSSRK